MTSARNSRRYSPPDHRRTSREVTAETTVTGATARCFTAARALLHRRFSPQLTILQGLTSTPASVAADWRGSCTRSRRVFYSIHRVYRWYISRDEEPELQPPVLLLGRRARGRRRPRERGADGHAAD